MYQIGHFNMGILKIYNFALLGDKCLSPDFIYFV